MIYLYIYAISTAWSDTTYHEILRIKHVKLPRFLRHCRDFDELTQRGGGSNNLLPGEGANEGLAPVRKSLKSFPSIYLSRKLHGRPKNGASPKSRGPCPQPHRFRPATSHTIYIKFAATSGDTVKDARTGRF